MGEYLYENSSLSSFTIGSFCSQGSFRGNYGNPEELSQPEQESKDVKDIALLLDKEIVFVPFDQIENEWVQKGVICNDSFIDLEKGNTLVPGREFDLGIFIKNSSPSIPLK